MNLHAGLPVVSDDEWVSQDQATRMLGVSLARIASTIANGHLEQALNNNGDRGVTLGSVRAEKHWRRQAGWTRRLRRAIRDRVDWI